MSSHEGQTGPDRNSPEAIRSELLTRPLRMGLAIAILLFALKIGAELAKGGTLPDALSQMAGFLPLLLIPPLLTTMVALAVRHLHLNARFDEHVVGVGRRMTAIESAVQTAQLANVRIAAIEPHVRDEQDFEMMVRIASEWRRIDGLTARFPELQTLVDWKRKAILRDLWSNWERLGKGGMLVSDPEQEFELNELVLRLLTPATVRAVSWNDEAYWPSSFGKAFLAKQAEYLKAIPGRKVRRVFFAKESFDYSKIFARQLEAGIEVRWISLEEVLRVKRKVQDVVIYDGRCLKVSNTVGHAQKDGAELKEAELFFMAEQVEPAILSFDDIWQAASPVDNADA